jgi:pimeloyl-ACP methyl ester carboxylesterase
MSHQNTLLLLHGFSLNAEVMRRQMGPLASRLEKSFKLIFVDAPHTCPPAQVARLQRRWNISRPTPPHLKWWDASDDGEDYEGWETSRERLSSLLEEHEPAGIVGFSQGAIATAALSALATHGQAVAPTFVVLIAGAKPRAKELQPIFDRPIPIPSLHVVGEHDVLMRRSAQRLQQCYQERTRRLCAFDGGHQVPSEGPASDTIVEFARSHLSSNEPIDAK